MTNPLPRSTLPPAAEPYPASDAEIAARAAAGDQSAFELIMRRHNRRLFRLARSLVRSDEEAEDVLQEAYLRAYARLRDLTSGEALGAWLARIVANEALGRLRAAARVVSLEDFRAKAGTEDEDGADDGPASDEPGPERLAASAELRRLLEAAVDALPEEFRSVFVLREVEELSTAETAAWLAIRPETVKTRLHRARRLLQESLSRSLLAAAPSLFEFQGARCDRIVGRVLARLTPPPAAGEPAGSTTPVGPVRLAPRRSGRLAAFLNRWRKR